jgi:hypothetical protein
MRWTWIGIGFGTIALAGLLLGMTVGLGVAIQHRVIAPPELDLRVSGFRILAVVTPPPTHSHVGAVKTSCAPPWGGCCTSDQEFYLVWVLAESQADDSGPPISARALKLPLECI